MAQRTSISRTVEVEAPAEEVWALVSDLPGMGALSPENTGGTWLDGATGPAVGVRFRGTNRRGWRRWSTAVRITACDPGRRLSFDVASVGLAVARWTYEVSPTSRGCTVTETWEDRRGHAMSAIGVLATGVADREAHTARSIDHTLAAVKARAEGKGPTG